MSIIRPPPLPTSSSTVIEEHILPAHLGLTKHHLNKWRFVGGVFATVLVVGWIFIIVILIQEEKWQLVLVAWLVLYAAAHFCYWYFKRHHLLSIHSVICRRARGNVGEVGGGFPVASSLKNSDAPPSYDDIVKSEAPPPEYYSVVVETPKKSPFTFPKVFGRNSAPSTPCPTRVPTSAKPIFYLGSRKLPSSVANTNIPWSSGSSEEPPRKRSNPPPYLEIDRTSFVATSTSSPPPSRLPVVPSEQILSSILNNITVVSVELHEQPQLTTGSSESPSRPSEQLRNFSSDSNH